jgi:hypothetical protein
MSRILALFLAVLLALPGVARATLPTIATVTTGNVSFNGVSNTMMFDVVVTTGGGTPAGNDTDHNARVGFKLTSAYSGICGTDTGWTTSPAQRFTTAVAKTFRLWNFTPGVAYTYRVDIGPSPGTGADVYSCGSLGTPQLPTPLNALDLRYDKNGTPSSPYIISETSDCYTGAANQRKTYVYAINPTLATPRIVWYLDEDAISSGKGAAGGFRYQPGTGSDTGRIMLNYNARYMYEVGFDGNVVASVDLASVGVGSNACTGKLSSKGPCTHHDLFKSDTTGIYYAPATRLSSVDAIGTDWEQACGTGSLFANDAFIRSDGTSRSLMINYGFNPRVYGGPHPTLGCSATTLGGFFNPSVGVIDWTHVNAVTTDNFGGTEYLTMSLKEMDQVIRFLASSPYTRQWTLANLTADSDFSAITTSGVTGAAGFGDQHDAHFVSGSGTGGNLMLFDNTGDPRGSRVLRIAVTPGAPGTAVIDRAWMVLDRLGAALSCSIEGTAEEVPGTSGASVVALCRDTKAIVELSQSTGLTGTAPPLAVSLTTTGVGASATVCTNGQIRTEASIGGWHRAFPAANLGAY